jgi:hypothetical protein
LAKVLKKEELKCQVHKSGEVKIIKLFEINQPEEYKT